MKVDTKPRRKAVRNVMLILSVVAAFLVVIVLSLALYVSAGAPGAIPSLAKLVNGQKIGRYGRVNLIGVTEIQGGAKLDRIILSDAQGPWLDIKNLELKWKPAALLGRRLSIISLQSTQTSVLRRPVLTPASAPKRLPIDVNIASFGTNLRISSGVLNALPTINHTTSGQLALNRDNTFDVRLKSISALGPADRFEAVISRLKNTAILANVSAQGGSGGIINALLGVVGATSTRLEIKAQGNVKLGTATGSLVSDDAELGTLSASWDQDRAAMQAGLAPDPQSWIGSNLSRFGGRVSLSATADGLRGEKRNVVFLAEAPALRARFSGPVEFAKARLHKGSILTIERGDLRLLSDQKVSGLVAGRFEIENTGFGLLDTQLKGTLTGTDVRGFGLSFASLSAPIRFTATPDKFNLTGQAKSANFAPANAQLAALGTSPALTFDLQRDRRAALWTLKKANLTGKGITAAATGRLSTNERALGVTANLSDISAFIPAISGRGDVNLSFAQTDAAPWRGRARVKGQNLSSSNQVLKQLIGSRFDGEIIPSRRAGPTQFSWRVTTGAAQANGVWQTGSRVPLRGQWALNTPFVMQSLSVAGQGQRGPNGDLAFGTAGLAVGSDGARIAIGGWTLTNAQILGVGGTGGKPFAVSLQGIAPLGPANITGLVAQTSGILNITNINARHAGLQALGNARGNGSTFDGLFDLNVEPGAMLVSGSSTGKLGFAVRNGKVGLAIDMGLVNAGFKGAPFTIPAGRLTATGLLGDLAAQFAGDIRAGARQGTVNLRGKANLSGQETSLIVTGGGVLDGKPIVLSEPLRAVPLGAQARLTGQAIWDGNRLSLDGKIRDGGLDVRFVEVDGENLFARISGRLGGDAYRLNGTARITDFSAFNQRLRGSAQGNLEIGGGASQGWTARFTGQGQGVSVGTRDFDTLLGDRPRFEVAARGQPNRPIAGSWRLIGRQLSGEGIVASPRAGQLPDLSGAWRIQGPVTLGGADIAGQINGRISLAGGALNVTGGSQSLAIAGQNWSDATVKAQIANVLAPTNIPIDVAANGSLGPLRAQGLFVSKPVASLQPLTFNYGGVAAQGNLLFGEAGPTGFFQLQASPGQMLTSGNVAGTVRLLQGSRGTQIDAQGNLSNVNLGPSGVENLTGKVTAAGPLQDLTGALNLDFMLRGQPARAALNGRFVQADQRSQVTLNGGGLYQGSAWRLQEPLLITTQNQATRASGRAVWREADLSFQSTIERGNLNATANLKDAPASLFGSASTRLDGRLNGTLSLTGRAQNLTGEAQFQATGLKPSNASAREAINGTITATLRNNSVLVRGTATNSGGLRAQGDARLPVDASLSPFKLQIVSTRALEGSFDINGPVESVARLGLSANATASGTVSARGQLSGTFASPSIRGRGELVDAALRDPSLGVRVTQANAVINFLGSNADIESLTANDGRGGKISLAGQINLTQGSNWRLAGVLDDFQLINSTQALIVATGNWSLASVGGQATLGGDLVLNDARIGIPSGGARAEALNVREINRPARLGPVRTVVPASAAASGGSTQTSAKPLLVDLRVTSNRNARVVGRGFDGAFDLGLTIKGNLQRPVIDGRADLVRGRFDLAGRSFDLTTGRVTFLSPLESSRIEFIAERETNDVIAIARIQGTLGRPVFKLESTPPAPQDEVLSRILFGRNVAALSLTQAAQLALGVTSLTTGTQLDPTARLGQALGLERFSLGTESGGFSGFTAGLRLVRDVYVEVVTGGEDGTVTMLEWRPRRRVQVQVTTSQKRESSVSIRLKSKE